MSSDDVAYFAGDRWALEGQVSSCWFGIHLAHDCGGGGAGQWLATSIKTRCSLTLGCIYALAINDQRMDKA